MSPRNPTGRQSTPRRMAPTASVARRPRRAWSRPRRSSVRPGCRPDHVADRRRAAHARRPDVPVHRPRDRRSDRCGARPRRRGPRDPRSRRGRQRGGAPAVLGRWRGGARCECDLSVLAREVLADRSQDRGDHVDELQHRCDEQRAQLRYGRPGSRRRRRYPADLRYGLGARQRHATAGGEPKMHAVDVSPVNSHAIST